MLQKLSDCLCAILLPPLFRELVDVHTGHQGAFCIQSDIGGVHRYIRYTPKNTQEYQNYETGERLNFRSVTKIHKGNGKIKVQNSLENMICTMC